MSCRHSRFLLLVCIALVFLCLASELTAADLCLPDQSSALLQLKRSFSSSKLASWRLGTDCCNWDGIVCDQGTGQVTALDLSNRSISGELGSSLFNLTSLRYLNLAYNLFDQIPLPASGFGKLSNITYLNLSNSGFIGQVPGDIAHLTNLISLDLSTFYLNEEPNSSITLQDPNLGKLIANLSNLQKLYLDGVNISADGLEWCRVISESAPGLRELSLTGCSLGGPIDSSLSRLRMLSKLCLDQNILSSSVPEFFAEFSYLTVLRLSSCGLNGVFPGRIFQLRNLTVIDASENPMLSGQFPEFPKGSALESLVLSNTNFSGGIHESVGNLKSLRKLQLMSCNFYGAIPSSLENLTHLVHLDLSGNNFSGKIPSVTQWHGISDIILTNNRLTGSLPSSEEFMGLWNLTKIDLRNNSLLGSIPVSLFALPSLQLLVLSQNHFSGHLKFSNASSTLQTVDLSNNNLQGPIPKSVFQLLGLRVLVLASNNFSGILEIGMFQSLRNLSKLDLSSNILSIVEGDGNSSFALFPKIRTLSLVSCNLTKLPGFLRYQDGMSSLDLSNNKISGAIPNWIWNIGESSYSYLNLSYNMFTSVEGPLPNLSAIPTMVLDFQSNMLQGSLPLPPPNTIVMDYSNNNFMSSIPSNFTLYLSYTVFFSMSNNNLTGEIPHSICNASYLQVLDLSNNSLSGSIPSCLLKGNNDLRILNLRDNLFSGTLPQDISKGCVLRTINLNRNKLEGKLPRSLANCDMLEVLDIGNNHIVGTFPYFLGNLSQLRVLVLRSNGFYGPILNPPASQLINPTFPTLQIFDISSNHFNGSLPSGYFKYLKAMMVGSDSSRNTVGFSYLDFGPPHYYQNSVTVTIKGLEVNLVKILMIFTSLHLSSNGFEGSIPDDIGELKLLYLLNMSHNSLKGEIPYQLGELVQLESLDLSSNQLSGQIPQELTALTFLSYLNLSYNNLAGRIPQVQQFLTFSNTSFLGNEGLCGLPLSKQCSATTAVPVSKSKLSALMSSINLNWQFIFTGVGFGGGLAMVLGPLMMWSKGKSWYNKHVDSMLLAILPVWLCNTCGNGKVGAEGDNDPMEEEEKVPNFCLFCTGLEFSEERIIIRHVECSCHTLDE
ncbi:receptor-like protein 7 [Typha latifolia]|uniref:receptor-like protein 7 n=1 Tax=Typha latifolia TaxID=4733 RepID=UPI003C2DC894